MAKSVLIVDDSLYMRKLIRDAVEEGGYAVIGEGANGQEAIDLALELNPDNVTLDNILPDMIGIDELKVYQKEGLSARVVMNSAVGQASVISETMSLGAKDYVVKPFTSEKLIEGLAQS